MEPKISIITVCFNSEKTIEQTIKSVLSQTYDNYEYIIVDGESTDETLNIVYQYEPLFNGKMIVISEPDKGIYDAMNKGIRKASGELIGIVNSDDYYEHDALENIVNAYCGYKYSIIFGLLRKVIDGKEVSVYLNNPDFLEKEMITHPTCFISSSIYKEFGVYSLDYKYSADYEFMLRIYKNKKIRFVEIYKIISNFSIDGASSKIEAYRETIKLKKEYELISKKMYAFQMLKSSISKIIRK